MNTPGPITAGFFEAIGRIVMRLPGVTSYVPASATSGPHAARNSSALAFATSARGGRGASGWALTRLQGLAGVVVWLGGPADWVARASAPENLASTNRP